MAHPIKPELVGIDFMSIKDTKGNNVFPRDFCDAAKKPSGVWFEYWWPKPGEKEGSRKIAYGLSAKGTPYVGQGNHQGTVEADQQAVTVSPHSPHAHEPRENALPPAKEEGRCYVKFESCGRHEGAQDPN